MNHRSGYGMRKLRDGATGCFQHGQKSGESLCVNLMPVFTLFCKLLFFFQSHCLTFEVVELLEFLQVIPIP